MMYLADTVFPAPLNRVQDMSAKLRFLDWISDTAPYLSPLTTMV